MRALLNFLINLCTYIPAMTIYIYRSTCALVMRKASKKAETLTDSVPMSNLLHARSIKYKNIIDTEEHHAGTEALHSRKEIFGLKLQSQLTIYHRVFLLFHISRSI